MDESSDDDPIPKVSKPEPEELKNPNYVTVPVEEKK